MAVYLPTKKSTTYVYEFIWQGVRYKDSTYQTKKHDARLVEAKVRLDLGAHPAPRRVRDAQRFVYFIQCDDAVKIGIAVNVASRFMGIQVGSLKPLTLLAAVAGGFPEERAVHRRFAHLRVRGEWFSAAPELLTFIADLPGSLT